MKGLVRRVGDSLANIAAGGLNLLFPPRCAFCRVDIAEAEEHVPICAECCRRLVPETWVGCRHCGGALSNAGHEGDSPIFVDTKIGTVPKSPDNCSLCKDPPLLFDRVVTIGGYRDNLRDAILRMKHPQHENLSLAMGRLLGQKRFNELDELEADLIVPIPMYWMRRLRRGTNSAELLARCLGRKLRLPVKRRMLVRCKNTQPQSEILIKKKRFNNMRGAFRVRWTRQLKGVRVLLVDDVLTTGATCSEAAAVLKKAGAAMVAVAVVARAQGRE
jgi:ComF family protein